MEKIKLAFDNSYARELPGCYVHWQPQQVPEPSLLFFGEELARELGIDPAAVDEATLASTFSGNQLPEGATPIAQAYAGHQFGNFSPQLGDGRALLIGELVDRHGRRRDLAFKGSGPTPFARRGDGKAALGPMLREVLVGEAMHALGIPTTRALAVVATGEPVFRDRYLPGAVLTRVAASHLRVGTFEYFAARGDHEQLRRLADYAIARHYPELADADERHLGLLRAVTRRQAALVAQWMGVGFIHGVMNTDNTSIAGETIDYGPCAFMEAYDPQTVYSSIDRFNRYAYENQPRMAHWNLARLAEALLPLLADDQQRAVDLACDAINAFPDEYRRCWLASMRAKLGLNAGTAEQERSDVVLVEEWLTLLQRQRVDFTLAWRWLADAAEGRAQRLRELFAEPQALDAWLARWQLRCAADTGAFLPANPVGTPVARAQAMREVNPWIIARNHRVEEALAAASDDGDLAPFQRLLAALAQPYREDPALAAFAEPAPSAFTASYRTFCGT